MMSVKFSPNALEDFWYLYGNDKISFKRLREIIKDTQRNGTDGIGKPELLSGNLAGYWSKRINEKDRFVFKIKDDCVNVYSCRLHYNDK